MFDNILLPIDLNHPSSWEKALPMAQKLSGETGTIHLLGIVHDIGAASIAAFLPADFETKALQKMKSDLDAFIASKLTEGSKALAHVGHGHIPEHILSAANDLGADLIVMASHPPEELMTFLVSSNADKVVRHAKQPVLVVR
ncbi:universal stress protein [Sagittula stellata]|uniref:UspA n=1 Tax=Sagittula stellata (strain ATCC 700073 / DSM 11524 / E-37) TaxID=388399 RepID=A3JX35_SAGS3|nr:universal stress protein [Sagittula stellata]EBA10071.1 UspA [Sagittula stellata E-37]